MSSNQYPTFLYFFDFVFSTRKNMLHGVDDALKNERPTATMFSEIRHTSFSSDI